MCARVRLATDYSEIKIRLRLDDEGHAPNFPPRWNIPPTADLLVAIYQNAKRRPKMMRWGLIPVWAKDEKIGYRTFNARADTVDSKPAFRGAWGAGRRCLVVTDGFYEWRKNDKQPFAVGMADKGLMAMAGLWETWKSPTGEAINSVTIITTDAAEAVAPIHHRMPVVVAEKNWRKWLGEEPATTAEVKAMLEPFPSEQLAVWPVDRRVGNVKNDGPELVEAV